MGRRIHEITNMKYMGMSIPRETEEEAINDTKIDYFKNLDYYIEHTDKYKAIFYKKDPTIIEKTKERIRQVFT